MVTGALGFLSPIRNGCSHLARNNHPIEMLWVKGWGFFSFPWKLTKPSPWKLGFCRWHFLDGLHPGRLTWNLQITHEKKGKWSEPNLQGIMVHFYLPGCNFPHSPIVPPFPSVPPKSTSTASPLQGLDPEVVAQLSSHLWWCCSSSAMSCGA